MPDETAEQPVEKTENTELQGFEKRFAVEMQAKEVRNKEVRYQYYRLEHEFGLPYARIEEWKTRFKLGIELCWLREKPYIYRVISLGEHTTLADKNPDIEQYRRHLLDTALLWPGIVGSDLLSNIAGLPQTLAETILRASGFDEVVTVPI